MVLTSSNPFKWKERGEPKWLVLFEFDLPSSRKSSMYRSLLHYPDHEPALLFVYQYTIELENALSWRKDATLMGIWVLVGFELQYVAL